MKILLTVLAAVACLALGVYYLWDEVEIARKERRRKQEAKARKVEAELQLRAIKLARIERWHAEWERKHPEWMEPR